MGEEKEQAWNYIKDKKDKKIEFFIEIDYGLSISCSGNDVEYTYLIHDLWFDKNGKEFSEEIGSNCNELPTLELLNFLKENGQESFKNLIKLMINYCDKNWNFLKEDILNQIKEKELEGNVN